MSSAEFYVRENNLHIVNQVGKEWNWDVIDANKDSVVNEEELVAYLMEHGGLTQDYAAAVAQQLMAEDEDGAVTFNDLRKGLDEYGDYTAILVSGASVAGEGQDGASSERRGGDFALYFNEESQSYQWAIRADNGRYYDVQGTVESEGSADQYWQKYRAGEVGIEFDEAHEVDVNAIFRPGQGDAQQLDTPPEFAQALPEGQDPANGTWFLVDGLYVFVENKQTSDNKAYLDVHIYDSEGAVISGMTGDPHVNEVGGDDLWDWHYTDNSSFQIGDLVIEAQTSDLGGSNNYNTQVTVRTGDNVRMGKTINADGNILDTADSGTFVFQKSASLLDGLDLDMVNGHTLAFLVFLDANETLNGVLGDILKGLAGRNRNIDDIRDIYSFVNTMKAEKYKQDGGDQALSYDEFAVLIQANQLTGGKNQALNNYYVDMDAQGNRVIMNRATDEAIEKDGPFPEGWDDHRTMTKDEVGAVGTALEQAMQEQTGQVELMMTRVKNFLTKQEAFVSATGSVTAGQSKMYDRVT